MNKIRDLLKANKRVSSICILFFFVACILTGQIVNIYTTAFWYVSCILCVVQLLFTWNMRLSKSVVCFILGILVTGAANILYSGNSSILQQAYTLMSVFIALLILSDSVDENVFLIALYLNVAVIVISFIRFGIGQQVYLRSSNNFVSVQLLYPLTMYYVLMGRKELKLKTFPVILMWILCLLAMGRGGIITGTVMLFGVILFQNFRGSNKASGWRSSYLVLIMVFTAFISVFVFLFGSELASRWTVLQRFSVYSFNDNGRVVIWNAYINRVKSIFGDFLFGAPFSEIPIVIWRKNNMHNSFMNIHAYNGIFAMITVVVMCTKAIVYGWKKKQLLFLTMLLAFFLRGFTDNMFWGATGTPFFFVFIFYPIYPKIQTMGSINESISV